MIWACVRARDMARTSRSTVPAAQLTRLGRLPRLQRSMVERTAFRRFAGADEVIPDGGAPLMLRWYLIYTKPASEALALENLARQRYEIYLPRVVQSVRRGGRRHERVMALFPRYLFLRLREGQQALGPVASTVGVAGIVRFGSQYTIVPERVISDLQARADPVTGLHRLSCGMKLQPGVAVRIRLGPFDGLEGVFEREAGADRVVVLLRLLGQSAPVCVPADAIVLSQAV
jgi:transcriptional antiterminator RfaH